MNHQTTTYSSLCSHKGATSIFPFQDETRTAPAPGLVVVGSEYQCKDTCAVWRPDLILSLNGSQGAIEFSTAPAMNPSAKALIEAQNPFPSLNRPPIPRILFDWKDQSGPPVSVGPAFIAELAAWVLSGKSLMFHCMAGHGRTGTLAVALYKALKVENGDLVALLRSIYCTKAVETKEQFEWLRDVMKVETTEKPSHSFASVVYHGGSGKIYEPSWTDKDYLEDDAKGNKKAKGGKGSPKGKGTGQAEDPTAWRKKRIG